MKTRVAGLSLLNAFLLLGYLWCRLQTYTIGYDISRTLDKLQDDRELNTRLKLEYTHLASPARVRTIAETKLGLSPLKPEQRFVLEVAQIE